MTPQEILHALADGHEFEQGQHTLLFDGESVRIINNKDMTQQSVYIYGDWKPKPRTININGFEVPDPLRVAPKKLTTYYVTRINGDEPIVANWDGGKTDMKSMLNGVAHLTREAAIIHAKALRSFTCNH